GRASGEERDHPDDQDDRRDSDNDGKPIRLFFLRREWWPSQAAHGGIVDCRFLIVDLFGLGSNSTINNQNSTMLATLRRPSTRQCESWAKRPRRGKPGRCRSRKC